MRTHREGLVRSVPFQVVRADDGGAGDGLTLEGYAAVFGQATRIDSWEGMFDESIRPGAFRKSIRERTPVLQFDHGRHPLVGSIPIGAIRELREDGQGLYVSARLSDNWLVEPVRDAIRDGAVDGMSFRFSVVREEWRDAGDKLVKDDELARLLWDPGDRGPLQRELVELKCAELGPVVFPAYEGTSVGVRAREAASLITRDDEFRREIRRMLATGHGRDYASDRADEPDLSDPSERREVARAILFSPDKIADAPPDPGHPSIEPRQRAGLIHDQAAPLEEHPATPDAPPIDGHPSADPTFANRLRDQIREIRGLMDERLATIDEEK